MRKTLEFNIPFKSCNLFRLDSLISDEIAASGFDKGVIRITGPQGLFFSTMEFNKDLVEDFNRMYKNMEKNILPKLDPYLKSKLPGRKMDIPVNLGRLVIGDWQQIVFYTTQDFENIRIELEFFPSDNILGLESMETTTELQTFDITDIIERTLMNCEAERITLVAPSTSVMLYTLKPEYYQRMIDFLMLAVPKGGKYHHVHGSDRNRVGYTPLRSILISQILTLDTSHGGLSLDGERLYLTEMDIQPRRRDIYFELWNKGESR